MQILVPEVVPEQQKDKDDSLRYLNRLFHLQTASVNEDSPESSERTKSSW